MPSPAQLLERARAEAAGGRHDAAAATLEAALALVPDSAGLWAKLGVARHEIGQIEAAIEAYRRAIALSPGDPALRQNLLHALVLRSSSPAELRAEHRAWGELVERGLPPAPPFDNGRDPGRPLRIGYVSGDLAQHAVALFIEPVLAGHDPAACRAVCYDARGRADAVTARLRALPLEWREIARLGDDEVARRVRADRIDVLVDLSGHTALNRLGVFARRAAPVQVTYLGYLATTGLAAMDWRLSDAEGDPPGAEAEYEERLWRLPGCMWCFRPPRASLALRWRARPEITFGSLNNSRKLSEPAIALWAEVLRRAPGSRLLIATLPESALRARILAQLAGAGVEPARVECLPWLPPAAFAELHARVDIALDSAPCGGGTTTVEALWHGVPVISLAGPTFPGRAGRSILRHAGLPELVATTPEQFVETALALAADRDRLAALHAALPERLQRSALMDEARFVRGLEQAYRGMWRAWLDSEPEVRDQLDR